jgi:hypothetical protein
VKKGKEERKGRIQSKISRSFEDEGRVKRRKTEKGKGEKGKREEKDERVQVIVYFYPSDVGRFQGLPFALQVEVVTGERKRMDWSESEGEDARH